MKRYVVTGPPGAGKTAVIRQLEMDGAASATDVVQFHDRSYALLPWQTTFDFPGLKTYCRNCDGLGRKMFFKAGFCS
jgi:predicted ATPase